MNTDQRIPGAPLRPEDLVLSAQDHDYLLIERPGFPGVIGVVHHYRGHGGEEEVRDTLARLAPRLGRLGTVLRRTSGDDREPHLVPVTLDPASHVQVWEAGDGGPEPVLAEITRQTLPEDRPLLRVHVIQGTGRWWLVFSFHHVAVDGATMGRILGGGDGEAQDPVPPPGMDADTARRVRMAALEPGHGPPADLSEPSDPSQVPEQDGPGPFPAVLPRDQVHRSLATADLGEGWRRLRADTGRTKGELAAWLTGAGIAGAVAAARGHCGVLGLNVTVDLRRAGPPPLGGNWTGTILCPWDPARGGHNLEGIAAALRGSDRQALHRQALAYEAERRDVTYAQRWEETRGWGEHGFLITPDGERTEWHAMVVVLPRVPAWHAPQDCEGSFVLPGAWLGLPWAVTWAVGDEDASVCVLSSSADEPADAVLDALVAEVEVRTGAAVPGTHTGAATR